MKIIFLNPDQGERLRDRINANPEFKLASKFFSSRILLKAGDSKCVINVRDGVITELVMDPPPMDPWSFCITASVQSWEKFLQPLPPPYFADLYGAMVRQHFEPGGDIETMFIHFWALTRMLDVIREIQNEGSTKP